MRIARSECPSLLRALLDDASASAARPPVLSGAAGCLAGLALRLLAGLPPPLLDERVVPPGLLDVLAGIAKDAVAVAVMPNGTARALRAVLARLRPDVAQARPAGQNGG
eukprot:365056-Chlamydomonas_euryale.AAC.3